MPVLFSDLQRFWRRASAPHSRLLGPRSCRSAKSWGVLGASSGGSGQGLQGEVSGKGRVFLAHPALKGQMGRHFILAQGEGPSSRKPFGHRSREPFGRNESCVEGELLDVVPDPDWHKLLLCSIPLRWEAIYYSICIHY